MKRNFLFWLIVLAAVAGINSCEKGPSQKGKPKGMKDNDLSLIHLVVQGNCGGELTSDLIAGKTTKVGLVRVTTDGGHLKVSYEITEEGWMISETHLSVTPSLSDVPSEMSLNPKIGLFGYKTDHDPYVSTFSYSGIPVEGNKELYILAHAKVEKVTGWKSDIEGVSVILPEFVRMSVSSPYLGAPSYFTTTVTEGGILDGTYPGWCIDVGNVIYPGTEYHARVVSSYDAAFNLEGQIDKPENLGMINWIINQDFPGSPSSDGTLFTFGDVQRAIWELVDNDVSVSGLGPWSQERVNEIKAEAAGAGEEFVPECGQKIGVILLPVDASGNRINTQITISGITIITLPEVCKPVSSGSETAWAAGYDFGGRNWAKYFVYCVK